MEDRIRFGLLAASLLQHLECFSYSILRSPVTLSSTAMTLIVFPSRQLKPTFRRIETCLKGNVIAVGIGHLQARIV